MRKLFMHPCIFHQVTGFYCPGCGGTRAVLALVKGNIIQSFLYHPIVVYTAGLLIWYGISHVLEWISKGKLNIGMRFRNRYVYAGLFIVLINWLIRNFLLFQYGITLGDL
ncbi:DUF2752 domain-containing protein [Ruminococcus sp. OA3]|uniref:DUF2752 domain-containing protein n=1 Tax=Ruminococcus sp. OA3 TaxID=2914164 RepID=UPI001F05430D|nr:DUF2752 domain-containing protein [Ruminococcus sp. OA3]MCH1981029.1 DUF2752 domain-containing protein [Ruminococcus sp. OA3]